jgi:putative DNA-invertase from lambdoid prophage Rac
MTDYGYTRTSTDSQDGAGQIHRLLEAGIPHGRIFTDQGISGMRAERPAFSRVLSLLEAGDVLVVPELSRLGRSVKNVLAVIEDLESRSVGLRILDLALDTTTPVGRMTVTVLAAVARLERDLISERTKAALDARKAQGMKLGAPAKLTPAQERIVVQLRAGGAKPADIAADMEVSRATVYRVLARAEVAAG